MYRVSIQVVRLVTQITLIILLAAVGIGAITPISPRALTPAELLQQRIDATPTSDGIQHGHNPFGGVITLPAGVLDLGERPLYVYGGTTLIGEKSATVIRYTGTGDAIRIACRNTHGFIESVSLRGFQIDAPSGGGIGFDASATGEASDIQIGDVAIGCAGIGVDLRLPRGGCVYQPKIDNVNIVSSGPTALAVRGRMVSLTALKVLRDNPIVRKPSLTAPPLIDLSGASTQGTITDCWIQGYASGPMLKLAGTAGNPAAWSIRGNWTEPGNAQVIQLLASDVRIDCDRLGMDAGVTQLTRAYVACAVELGIPFTSMRITGGQLSVAGQPIVAQPN